MGVLSATTLARLRELPPKLAFHDRCEIRRDVSSGFDEFNAALPPTEATVGAGPCALRKIGQQGNERLMADRLGWTSAYAIDLSLADPVPLGDVVTRTDRIRVNGNRVFHVGDIDHAGNLAIKAVAIVEERG